MTIEHLIILVLAIAAMLVIAIFLFRHRSVLAAFLRETITD